MSITSIVMVVVGVIGAIVTATYVHSVLTTALSNLPF